MFTFRISSAQNSASRDAKSASKDAKSAKRNWLALLEAGFSMGSWLPISDENVM